MKKPLNHSLQKAKAVKQDEFYTQLCDIKKEIQYYVSHFKGKIVLCNCDDPTSSNFAHFFLQEFKALGLKKLIVTCYTGLRGKKGIKLTFDGDKPRVSSLKGNGDFRNEECLQLLKQADLITTNPPFSLFREYVSQLDKFQKKFLIIGNHNFITYLSVFNLIKNGKAWMGISHPLSFIVPDEYENRSVRSWRDENGINWRSLGNACWLTNLDHKKRHDDLILSENFNPEKYPTYDNYKAIEVSRYKDIPKDYFGVMGVPITFLEHHNPQQFEIVGSDYNVREGLLPGLIREGWEGKLDRGYVAGKRKFSRIFIRRQKIKPKKNENHEHPIS